MPRVKVNDIQLYYEVHGKENRDWMVLISILGFDSSLWQFQVPEFAKEYRVLVFDNRGAGRSDKPDVPYSIKMMADDTVGLMDQLGIKKAHIVGSSMGGFIAQEMGINYPERVRSLTLVSASAHYTMYLTPADVIKELKEKGMDELVVKLNLFFGFTDNFLRNEELVKMVIDMMLNYPYPQPLEAYIRQYQACREFDARDRLHKIRAPTMILVGNKDVALPPSYSKELAEKIPGAKLVVLDGGGHALNFEIPDKFNKAVLNFVRKH